MDPAVIAQYLQLIGVITGVVNDLVAKLKGAGVTQEQIDAATQDYLARIARREAEASEN